LIHKSGTIKGVAAVYNRNRHAAEKSARPWFRGRAGSTRSSKAPSRR
jgi:hypothetical protein